MAYIKPSVLVYQELENAGGTSNATPDLGVVIIGPLYNVVNVDPTSDSSLTATLGASTLDLAADLEETIPAGPTGLKIDLKSTKPGQLVTDSSIVVTGTNNYVRTFAFDLDVGTASTTEFDGGSFRSKITLWDTVTETYNQVYTPTGVVPGDVLPDASGSHVRVGDRISVTYLDPDLTYTGSAVVTTLTQATVTETAHGLKVGDRVGLSNDATVAVDGQYTITHATLNTFKVAGTFTVATGTADVAKIVTLKTTITKVETGTSTNGTAITKSLTIAQPVASFTAGASVDATVTVDRFYDQMTVPATYIDGINTIQQFDTDSRNDDYIWLLADIDPPFGAVGPAAYSTVTFGSAVNYAILSGNFHVTYKALRQDKYSTILNITSEAERLSFLGEASPENPLGLGVKIAMDNTTTSVMAVSLKQNEDTTLDWTRGLELIENQKTAYAIVPLTQDTAVLAAVKAHVEQMSTPVNAAWRVALLNTEIPSVKYILQANADAPVTTGSTELQSTTLYLKDLAHTNGDAVTTGEFIGAAVTPGDVLVVTAVTGYTTVVSTTATGLVPGRIYKNISTGTITIGATSVAAGRCAIAVLSTTSTLLTNDPTDLLGSFVIDEVTNSNYLKVLDFEGFADLVGLGITYYIYRDLTRLERASAVAGASFTFKSNRVWHIQPDIVGVNVGGAVQYLPGYYLACGHGGMTAGFPAQQGFTNIAVAGIEDLQNSNFYFKKEELNIMAEAGTCLYVQETQGSLPYCRHSLTTDMTVLEYREQVKVKNWDFLSFFYYDKMRGFIGTWNITTDTLSNMKQTMIAASELLLTQKLPRIGAPLLSYEEPSVVQNEFNKDMVDIRMKIETVTPNNYTNIYLVI